MVSGSVTFTLDTRVPVPYMFYAYRANQTKEKIKMDISNFTTLANSVLPADSLAILESIGAYAPTLSYLESNNLLDKFVLLVESATSDPMSAMTVNVVLMSKGAMCPNLVQFKVRKVSSRAAKDPWSASWLDSAKSEMAKRISAYAQTQVRPILEGLALSKGAEGAIPSSGLPAEIVAHLSDPEVTDEQLMIDFFHSQLSHTVLLKGGLQLPAVNYRGETLIADAAGNAKTVNVSFGWRADGCRKAKKKAPKSTETPAAEAATPAEEYVAGNEEYVA